MFKLSCSIFSFFCVVLYRSFSLFLSPIILSVPLRLTAFNYPFRIFKVFLGIKQVYRENNKWYCTEMILISDCHNSWQIYDNNFALIPHCGVESLRMGCLLVVNNDSNTQFFLRTEC
jgi:hypothetical protein